MGQIGAPTPPVTTPRLINYFKARGIDFPNNATITYNRRAGEILVTNTVENLRRMEDLLRQLDEVRSPLVSIEARIVELSELDLQELGFDWALNIHTTEYASGESSWQVPNNQNPLRHYAADNEKKGAGNLAGLAIGLTLVLIHIVCIPITGTSVNPARSIGPALMEGGQALEQLWLFIVAPFIGAAFSALAWNFIKEKD